jgi:hypothetical protein
MAIAPLPGWFAPELGLIEQTGKCNSGGLISSGPKRSSSQISLGVRDALARRGCSTQPKFQPRVRLPAGGGQDVGNSTEKTVPASRVDTTSILPPCERAI